MEPLKNVVCEVELVRPESIPSWRLQPFFRQEAEERWMLLAGGLALICNGAAYEVLKRVDGQMTVGLLFEYTRSVLPNLTISEVIDLLSILMKVGLLEIDHQLKKVYPSLWGRE